MLSRAEIFEKLKEILLFADAKNSDLIKNCDESTKLVTDLGFNSVSVLYMVIAIEESFGIVFDNVSMNDFDTIGDVVTYIEARLK
ncbi:acyl carrier protein [Ruminococcus sp.]|jgi:acyl carrier protein|uniref:acyl carrier protein n=1 Tax=Ruminococcus sp. TaxID=41978 RepID=UPI00386FABA9